MKNIVQVIHEGDYNRGRYCFEVPLDITLEKGDVVLVATKNGNRLAHCATKTIMMSDEMVDMMMFGKKVTGKVLGKFEYKEF